MPPKKTKRRKAPTRKKAPRKLATKKPTRKSPRKQNAKKKPIKRTTKRKPARKSTRQKPLKQFKIPRPEQKERETKEQLPESLPGGYTLRFEPRPIHERVPPSRQQQQRGRRIETPKVCRNKKCLNMPANPN